MIALDTNILVRYFVEDDPVQSPLATAFVERELTQDSPGLVTIVALVELAWVLRRLYRASTEAVAELLKELLDAPQVVIEQASVVEAALALPHDDIADALIHAVGQAHRCTRTVTFDRAFARLAGVELLTV